MGYYLAVRGLGGHDAHPLVFRAEAVDIAFLRLVLQLCLASTAANSIVLVC